MLWNNDFFIKEAINPSPAEDTTVKMKRETETARRSSDEDNEAVRARYHVTATFKQMHLRE